ncbi:MAG: hypothetical protein Q4C98_10595 [Capnocytophaga sp.]|nr:hypothetical protein [Capnocytophaga sp.]
MNYIFLLVLFLFININSFSQEKYYEFPFFEGSRMITMRQSSEFVQNANRLLAEIVVTDKKSEFRYFTWSSILSGLLLIPITHEEGHRSVLSANNIGAVSEPIFDKRLIAKVTGVSNQTLITLREENLPTYIRLHTAGLESDICYLNSLTTKLSFEEEETKYVYGDMVMRYAGVLSYFFSTYLAPRYSIDESNVPELELDIVGHDIWGMIRHLYKPNEPNFYRYTKLNDLNYEEKRYAKRMAWFSLANLINPNLLAIRNFTLKNGNKISFNLSYSLAPFGDFFRQDIYYLVTNKNLKLNFHLSEYFNKSNFFLGGGLRLHNYKLSNKFLMNSSLDIWSQPKELDFTTKESDLGIGFSLNVAYKFFQKEKQSLFLNFGFLAKTEGFIPQNMALDSDFKMQMGLIYALKK